MHFRKHAALIALTAAFAAGATSALAAKSDPKHDARPAAAAAEPATQVAAGSQAEYGVKMGKFFQDSHKKAARRAFAQRYAKAKDCPAGMDRVRTKECAPPVQGRYWAVGQPLQDKVETHPVPEVVSAQLPPPPNGYEYVSAGEDVLLVSKGLHLVVDMIEDVNG
jgi:Ni/Co efflux regulator RcnB